MTERNRRTVIIGIGAGLAALAGCTGTGEDDPTYGGNGGDNETPNEDEVKSRPEGEDHLQYGDLEILEHEMVVESGEFTEDVTVEGVVENTSDEMFDYVEVGVRVYDAEGRHIDRYMTNTTDLGGNTEWVFEVMILDDAAEIEDYDIGIVANQY